MVSVEQSLLEWMIMVILVSALNIFHRSSHLIFKITPQGRYSDDPHLTNEETELKLREAVLPTLAGTQGFLHWAPFLIPLSVSHSLLLTTDICVLTRGHSSASQ